MKPCPQPTNIIIIRGLSLQNFSGFPRFAEIHHQSTNSNCMYENTPNKYKNQMPACLGTHGRDDRYLCSSSLFSWCRDRGGEGSSISRRSTPGTTQQAASVPMSCAGSLSRPTPRRERRLPPCCCPVVAMEPCCLLLWSPLAVPLSC